LPCNPPPNTPSYLLNNFGSLVLVFSSYELLGSKPLSFISALVIGLKVSAFNDSSKIFGNITFGLSAAIALCSGVKLAKIPLGRDALGCAMPSGAPAPAQAAPAGPMEAQPGGFAGTGAKSSPFAPTPGQVTDARKQALVIDKLMGSLNALEKNVQENSMQIGGMGAPGAAQEALFQDTMLQLKELQNLGVLQGRDEAILIQQLSNPTSLMTYIKGLGGPDYFFAKVKELKSKAERELSMINRQFPVPVTGQQPVAPAMPQRFTVPPGLGDILKRYPGAGG